jgi:hypothetical protein
LFSFHFNIVKDRGDVFLEFCTDISVFFRLQHFFCEFFKMEIYLRVLPENCIVIQNFKFLKFYSMIYLSKVYRLCLGQREMR